MLTPSPECFRSAIRRSPRSDEGLCDAGSMRSMATNSWPRFCDSRRFALIAVNLSGNEMQPTTNITTHDGQVAADCSFHSTHFFPFFHSLLFTFHTGAFSRNKLTSVKVRMRLGTFFPVRWSIFFSSHFTSTLLIRIVFVIVVFPLVCTCVVHKRCYESVLWKCPGSKDAVDEV